MVRAGAGQGRDPCGFVGSRRLFWTNLVLVASSASYLYLYSSGTHSCPGLLDSFSHVQLHSFLTSSHASHSSHRIVSHRIIPNNYVEKQVLKNSLSFRTPLTLLFPPPLLSSISRHDTTPSPQPSHFNPWAERDNNIASQNLTGLRSQPADTQMER